MESQPARPNTRCGFDTAIICALPLEADAVEALFDRHWGDKDDNGPPFDKASGDPNAYSTGVIGRHNVVLAYMPGMGKANAASVASHCRASFPRIRLALVVGVCGVVPFGPYKEEIVLGDVIISDGIIQYDFGRQLPGRYIRKNTLADALGRPNQEIRSALAKSKTLRGREQLGSKVTGYLNILRQKPELRAKYPGSANDKLFKASYSHAEDQKSCEELGCDGELVPRSRLKTIGADPMPAIHFGLMASGDSVMKSGKDRDEIAAAEGIIAFEMEGAGVWDSLPCIVIKGACDYADSHKSKGWQQYAAATAAAFLKAFLNSWIPSPTASASHHIAEMSLTAVQQAAEDLNETSSNDDGSESEEETSSGAYLVTSANPETTDQDALLESEPKPIRVGKPTPPWLSPSVIFPSTNIRSLVGRLSDNDQWHLAETIILNCQAACFEFYRTNALWRTKFSDEPSGQRLFQLDNMQFPSAPGDFSLQLWLAKVRHLISIRLNHPDGVTCDALYESWEFRTHISRFAMIPSIVDPWRLIDTDVFEEGFVNAIQLCRHLQAWDSSGRLKALWKEVHLQANSQDLTVMPNCRKFRPPQINFRDSSHGPQGGIPGAVVTRDSTSTPKLRRKRPKPDDEEDVPRIPN